MKKVFLVLLLLSTSVDAQNFGIKFKDKTAVMFNTDSIERTKSSMSMDVAFVNAKNEGGTLRFELGDGYCSNQGGILKMFNADGEITYLPWDKKTVNITSAIAHVFCDVMGYKPEFTIPKPEKEVKKAKPYNEALG